jgi:hypothetical protein
VIVWRESRTEEAVPVHHVPDRNSFLELLSCHHPPRPPDLLPLAFVALSLCTMSTVTFPTNVSTASSSCGSPPSRLPVRYLSPASLNLGRLFEQNRQRLVRRDGLKTATEPVTGQAPPKSKPRLLLMGQRRCETWACTSTSLQRMLTHLRSGKSSISSVVFHKLPPNETLFLESTSRIQKDAMTYVLNPVCGDTTRQD